MAASFENSRRFSASFQAVQTAVNGAMQDIGARSIRWSSDRQVSGKVCLNFRSWGEVIHATFDGDGNVWVRSVCAFPLQPFDWGRNADNCRRLLEFINARLTVVAVQVGP